MYGTLGMRGEEVQVVNFLQMIKMEVWVCFKCAEEAGEVVLQLGGGSSQYLEMGSCS